MKAIVLRDGKTITLEERPEPEPREGEVLVRTSFCGICGTDLHAPRLPDLFVPNVVMGHEFAGDIVAVGPDVSGWKPGDQVTINPNGNICGECEECRAGRSNLCRTLLRGRVVGVQRDGGMAEYVSLPIVVLHRLPLGVTALQGAWVEPLAVAMRAVRVAEFRVGGTALVLGAGPIGLLTLQVLRSAGAGYVAVVEPSPLRREQAERLGADVIVDPRGESPAGLFESDLTPPEYVFECAGIPGGIAMCAAVVRPGGCITVVGVCPDPLDLDMPRPTRSGHERANQQGSRHQDQQRLCGGI